MTVRRTILTFLVAMGLLCVSLTASPGTAVAQDTWQQHMAQANNFYRNRLFPKALEQLKLVVADPDGSKQLRAWQLIVQIADKLKDLDTLVWALEGGRELAQGQDAAQMQAQLYRLKRVYGRVLFEVVGGSGKLPARGIALKLLDDIEDPEVRSYYEKARLAFEQSGYQVGSVYLPGADYELDGAPLKVIAGKDTVVEVAPTADITFSLEVAGLGVARIGDATTGAAGGLGGLSFGLGPHIQFASGNSLLVQVVPMGLVAPQQTQDVQQDAYMADVSTRLSLGGGLLVGFEFTVGTVDISPRIGYLAQYMPSGMYYRGRVASSPGGTVPPSILEGDFVVPAIAHGPRVGIQALLSPPLDERGKRVPRVFVGFHGGPLWAKPLWGQVGLDQQVAKDPTEVRPNVDQDAQNASAELLEPDTFRVLSIAADPGHLNSKVFVDLQLLVGIQVRL